jgi:DNA-binding NarL/FixJ family response regulator
MIRVLLVDDQAIMRQGLKALLELESDIRVVGQGSNGRDALALVQAQLTTSDAVDVVLMDLRMPIMDGVAASRELHQHYPEVKILVLTTFDDDDLVHQALAAGALGYLLKDTPSEDLAQAIRAVQRGYAQFGPGIFQKLRPTQASIRAATLELPIGFNELTPREKEVLALIGKGANNREIASALHLSEGTVKNHVTHLLSRLDLRDRTQAALLAASLNPLL